MKQQISAWAGAFHASRAPEALTLQFYSGEALAFCRASDLLAVTGKPATGIVSAPPAPVTFDVIDTSNLLDHADILNLIVSARPLLKEKPASQSILYTETRRPTYDQSLTQSLLRRICVTIPTLSVLFEIAPRPYVSAFNSL
ncbi:hypothetical protein FRC10_007401 [Ceratobasidium sp. 414]|nr:hypothetical protein FRC10_007401 [Ceratobasidium sp. 414]